MTANPWISIVIPAWNREDTIARCLDSILAQRFTDYEILVVDDGSTDGTADIVRSYDDLRVHRIQHDRNRGSYAARATAIGVVAILSIVLDPQSPLALAGIGSAGALIYIGYVAATMNRSEWNLVRDIWADLRVRVRRMRRG